jgi:hypothetical protein
MCLPKYWYNNTNINDGSGALTPPKEDEAKATVP